MKKTKIKKKNQSTKDIEIKPKIFNLSSKALSRQHLSVLLRGLKFTPTPQQNKIEIKHDVQQFTRKLRLLEYFYKDNPEKEKNETSEISIIKDKSNFWPPRNRDKILDHNIDFINNLNLPDLNKTAKSNLS